MTDKELQQLLQDAFTHPVEMERDLWTRMQQRLERPSVTVPWFDWALAVAALVMLAFAPAAIPMLLYWL